MWIIRFHKLESKDYNFASRALKKMWFSPRKISPICFIKALFFHELQKKSWRAIWNLLWVNYIVLYNFYNKNYDNPLIKKIFYYFLETRIIVFVWEKKSFSNKELDSSYDFYLLTKKEIDKILG